MALCIAKFNRYSKVPIILLVIVSFLFLVCWTAPQAHAIAMTTTVGIVLLCTVLLAAFGVSITAPTNTSAIDYFTPKILAFAQSKGYNSIEDWVAGETGRRPTLVTLFSLVGGALVMDSPVWNCLLEYTKSFVTDENITSNGQPVGQIGSSAVVDIGYMALDWPTSNTNPQNTYNLGSSSSYSSLSYFQDSNGAGISWTMSPTSNINTSRVVPSLCLDTSLINGNIIISIPNTNPYVTTPINLFYTNTKPVAGSSFSFNTRTNIPYNSAISISSQYRYALISLNSDRGWGPNVSFYIKATGDVVTPSGTVITPSARVIDPDELSLGQNGLVYVPGIVDTMSQEDALNHVADKTATPGGLTAEPDKDGYPIPAGSEWLFDKLTDIDNGIQNQNPHTDWIPENGFDWSFQGIWHYVEDWIDSFTDGVSAVVTVWSELPPAIPGAFYGAMVAAIVIGVWRRFFEG